MISAPASANAGYQRIDWRNHQVNVERKFRVGSQRRHDARADCEIGNKVSVHHIDMDEICAGNFGRPNFFGKAREISGKDGWCDLNGLRHALS